MQCSFLHCRLCSSCALSPPPFLTLTCYFPGTHSALHHALNCMPDPYTVACLSWIWVCKLLCTHKWETNLWGHILAVSATPHMLTLKKLMAEGGCNVSLCLSFKPADAVSWMKVGNTPFPVLQCVQPVDHRWEHPAAIGVWVPEWRKDVGTAHLDWRLYWMIAPHCPISPFRSGKMSQLLMNCRSPGLSDRSMKEL